MAPIVRGSALLALVSYGAYKLRLNSASAGLVYLVTVTLNCLNSGFFAAVVVSILAVGCLDYFFVAPVLTWRVAQPVDGVALAAFVITCLMITRLSSKAREEARTATQGRRNMDRLYQAAQRLLTLEESGDDLSARILQIFRDVFGFRAGCLFDGNSAAVHMVGEPCPALPSRTRDSYILGRDLEELDHELIFKCLRVSSRTVGAIGFEGLEDGPLVAGPLAAVASAALDRAIAVRMASQAAAEAQAEALRGAILDALAHEFKTPLATILTAAGGIREAGPLRAEQSELTDMVEAEAERLSYLSSRLLRLAKLDRDEIKPRMELAETTAMVADVVERYARQYPGRSLTLEKGSTKDEVMADTDLVELAVGQLIDNACRYSPPASPVRIAVEAGPSNLAIIVWNGGSSISPQDCGRIFERFYRGADARRVTSGSGLGLYVARKIALAHGGSLEVDQQHGRMGGVAFRLTLPVVAKGSSLVANAQ